MPQQSYKRAEYKTSRDVEPYLAKRAEFYRCSEGFTVGSHMCGEGEIHHISELDIDVPDPNNAGMLMKAESFQPLSLPEQERRFGRVMYMPYEPDEDELQDLGWQRTGVTANDESSNEQLQQLHKEDFFKELEQMPEWKLREEAQYRYGLQFPEGAPPERIRKAMKRLYEEGDEEFYKTHVTDQMVANAAQRVPTRDALASTENAHQEIEERQKLTEESGPTETKEEKQARRRAKAQEKLQQVEEQTNG